MSGWRMISGRTFQMTFLRAFVSAAVPLLFLVYVFQIFEPPFWHAGLAHWLDPYFINALLEAWYISLRDVHDPSSPPMYFPVEHTLGYSHGLVLFAAFYIPLRLFLHPFLAYNWTVFLVLASGIVCLHVLFRKRGLTFAESLTLAMLFLTSRNVINEPLSEWTQRASVFLIPPILLLLVVSVRMTQRATSIGLAALGGFLSTLMYVQDFYTAHFAMLFVAAFTVAAVFVEGVVSRGYKAIRRFWQAQTFASTAMLATFAGAVAWASLLWTFGGGEIVLAGIELRSHDVSRPATIAVGSLIAFLYLNRRILTLPRLPRPNSWWMALTIGGAAGAVVFLWIYTPAYVEHRAFPEEQLLNQLLSRDPTHWTGPLSMIRDLAPYATHRSFIFVLVVAAMLSIPRITAGRKAFIYWMWLLTFSLVVLFIPLRLGEVSVWRTFIEPLPGFGVIRDPKRIVYVYELAVILATAALLSSFPSGSRFRPVVTLLAMLLVVTDRAPNPFRYRRAMAVFDRWVAAPITIDPSCKSFYITRGSTEYMSRSDHMWSQYGLDSLFVSLRLRVPTLNGYSAWAPEGWDLFNPQEAEYAERVTRWVDRHKLTDVCEFDIDARRMTRRAVK
jgi:hypothetical protein